ncbi:hypothetical protein [Alicyclobacillus sp. SO9]|uniref:hypothetical protein n=1 Tax=Alicyclobacillus sp. SO9 TaxID=2665646 RepID=UPI0018E76749|nr:hypothetical protein [Alicyclobacillus sp. SO9]QQE77221.1 hypothetical protein GI364_14755 [Alicyclobacillus sp. SO9]
MSFVPMESRTEAIVNKDAGFMEFDLGSDIGYQEWRGMFAELGVKATLFNGYILQQHNQDAQISTTPVQLHLFQHAMYLSPPFEGREYYFELVRENVRMAKAYFRIPPDVNEAALEGHKPSRDDLYALDIWVTGGTGGGGEFSASSLLKGNDLDSLGSGSEQKIYTLIYEARIKTDRDEYDIRRFESEQLFGQERN